MAHHPAGRDLEQPAGRCASQKVHGPQDGGKAHLESDSEPGRDAGRQIGSRDAPATELTPETIEAAVPGEFQPEPENAAAPATEPELQIASTEPEPEPAAEHAATEQPLSPAATDEPVANVGAQVPDVAPETLAATKKASRAKRTPTGETGAPREGSKTSRVIEMLKREGGTTLEEIMAQMGWMKHTTRSMLSAGGSLTKKHGLVVTSEKVGDKRIYTIKG